jgi:hypothetical protein
LDTNPPAGNTDATGNAPAGLPSTGNGGYLNSNGSVNVSYLLFGLGIVLMGSGSLVWAVSRKR